MRRKTQRRILAAAIAPCVLASGLFTAGAAFGADRLVADDSRNVIEGLTATHMWSSDGGATWHRAAPDDLFKGTKHIIVASLDDKLVKSSPWSAETVYDKPGTFVTHGGNVYKSKYWTSGDVPGAAEFGPWELVGKAAPKIVDEFDFTAFSGAAADKYQAEQRARGLATKRVAGYFPEWGIYQAHDYFTPDKVNFDQLTHLNYGFGLLKKASDGTWNVEIGDSWASLEKDGGNIARLNAAAKAKGVTTMISFGGWTNSENGEFEDATSTPEKTNHLAQSMVDFMVKYGFGGIDVDWEYPTDDQAKKQFTSLLKVLKQKLTDLGKAGDEYYQLSVATTANHKNVRYINPSVIKDYVDTVNVMSYDYNGAFNPTTGHNAPLYANDKDADPKFNVAETMKEYVAQGVPKSQLLGGVAYYGRGWGDVSGKEIVKGLPGLFDAGKASAHGQWDDVGQNTGTNPFSRLDKMEKEPGFVKYRDEQSKVPYLYNAKTGEFYSYDDEQSVTEKVAYFKDNNYGGAIIWDLSGDTSDHRLGSIVAGLKGAKNDGGETPSAPQTIDRSRSAVVVDSDTRRADGKDAVKVTLMLKDTKGNPVTGLGGDKFPKNLTVDIRDSATNKSTDKVTAIPFAEVNKGLYQTMLTSTTAGRYALYMNLDGKQLPTGHSFAVFTKTAATGKVDASRSSGSITTGSVLANGSDSHKITMVLKDAYGNPVSGVSGSKFPLVTKMSGAKVKMSAWKESGKGTYTSSVTSTEGGTASFTFTAAGAKLPVSLKATFEGVKAGVPHRSHSLVFVESSAHRPDGKDAVKVTIVLNDAFRNPVSGLSGDKFPKNVTLDIRDSATNKKTDKVKSSQVTELFPGAYEMKLTSSAAGKFAVYMHLDGKQLPTGHSFAEFR